MPAARLKRPSSVPGPPQLVDQGAILVEALHIVAPLVANQQSSMRIEHHRVGPDELSGSGPVCAPLTKVVLVQGDDADAQAPDRRVEDVRAAEHEQPPISSRRHIVRIAHAASELDEHADRLAIAIGIRNGDAHPASRWRLDYTNANGSKVPLTMGLASTWNQCSRIVL